MSLQSARQLVLGFHPDLPVVVEESAAQLSSDGGLLVIREFDQRLEFTARFAAALQDTRDPAFTRHGVLSLVRQRMYGLLADYEDQNDHDELRHDPVFKLICDRLPDGADLASQPTLSRFENAVTIADLKRLREFLLTEFLDSFDAPPVRITLDIDAFDDETHGQQQLTFFHGYDEYAARGESENRNKELKDGLNADRLSDHRFMANFFRLFLHAAALNLLVRLRRATTKSPTPAALGIFDPVPAAALNERSKKRFFNRRRRHDPLGEGQPCTWRSRLIKVAVAVIVSSRRVLVKLSSSWPHLGELFRLGDRVALSGSS